MIKFLNAILLTLISANSFSQPQTTSACVPVANEMTCQLIGGSYDEKSKLCCLKKEIYQSSDLSSALMSFENI